MFFKCFVHFLILVFTEKILPVTYNTFREAKKLLKTKKCSYFLFYRSVILIPLYTTWIWSILKAKTSLIFAPVEFCKVSGATDLWSFSSSGTPWEVFSSVTVVTHLMLICNANMHAKESPKDRQLRVLRARHFYLWTSWNFLPLRKKALPNAPWVFCEFSFIAWKLLLSTTLCSSFSFRQIPKKSAMFFTPWAGFWKEESNIQTNYIASQGVCTSLHLSSAYLCRTLSQWGWSGK